MDWEEVELEADNRTDDVASSAVADGRLMVEWLFNRFWLNCLRSTPPR